jgi:small ligand-binding sensory domain FIST
VWRGSDIDGGALTGIVLRGARRLRIGVTQACRPVTPLLTVTRAQGPWILELDGRPALDVYREAARAPLADDLRRAAAFVLAALPRDGEDPLAPGGYLVRNVAGFSPDANAFAIPAAVARGDRLALVHREPETAREDLKAMLAGLGDEPAGLALYFDCCARGAGFFGVPGLESAYLERALGPTPIAGMFGSCELGPVGGRTELLTYTGVLALLDS